MPLRLLHVTPYCEAAWGYGGIPRVVGALSRGLAERGHQVCVAATDAADATARLTPPPGRLPGVELRLFPNLSNAAAYHAQLFLPRGLEAFLRRQAARFDVAHLHACHHLPGAIAARQLRRAGVPWVLQPNGTAPRLERRRLLKWVFDLTLGRGVVPGASRILAVSRAEVAELRRLGTPPEKIALVPNPVGHDALAAVPRPQRFRERHGLDGPFVLYLGKLTPRKGVEHLVDAVAALAGGSFQLVIAGNDMGSLGRVRRRVARRGLAGRTVFTGLLRGAERFDALAAAAVVVYPSAREIFGLVPLEALLCGTPVVVADDSGCGEIVAGIDGGEVVPLGDAAALSAAIAATLDAGSSARQRAAAAGRRVRQRYSPAAVCGQLEPVYHAVVAASRGHREAA